MNCFSLALRSVIRKPVKSILLFVAVFIISLLLLSGMGSGKASIVMQDNTRQAMGAGLLLEENEADRHRRIEELSGQLDHKEGSLGGYHQEKLTINGVESWRTWTDNSFETLLVEDIEKIADTEGIADYNITTVTTAANPCGADTDPALRAEGVRSKHVRRSLPGSGRSHTSYSLYLTEKAFSHHNIKSPFSSPYFR